MRDPLATLAFDASCVTRTLHAPLPSCHFLYSGVASRWVARGALVEHEIRSPVELRSKRIPFVTYPHEWCDEQLRDAGRLTLELQEEAVGAGYELKDASAWNVVFDGCRPVFCDLLSFVPLAAMRWWAFGQYARHFVLPLLLSQRRALRAHQCFQLWRDGVPPAQAREILGWRVLFSRHAPLFLNGGERAGFPASDAQSIQKIRKFRSGLHEALRWMLPKVARGRESSWAAYESRRGHYSEASLGLKRQIVSGWLDSIRPAWVADLGCNTGEFSRAAARYSRCGVVAIDADHDSVQRLYREAHGAPVYPLVANLDDLGAGRGWAGSEFPGLVQRMAGQFDLVMMLALIHHLAIGESVPLEAIARFLWVCTAKWAIVETIDETDPQLSLLCARRQRLPSEFTEQRQRAALLAAGFEIEAEARLPDACRTLLLLRRPARP